MKNCIACNEQLEDDARFCSNCRKEQPEKVIEVEPAPKANKAPKSKKPIFVKKTAEEKPKKKKSNFQEKKKAIYELTPQDNCGNCGCANCMQFAMQAASPKNSMDLDDCPHIDEDDIEEFHRRFAEEDEEEKEENDDSIVAKKQNRNSQKKCPSCGSKKVSMQKKGFKKGALLFGVIGAAYAGVKSQQMQFVCEKCGHTWD